MYTTALKLDKHDPLRRRLFKEAKEQHGYREYDLHSFATTLRQSWLGEHLHSHLAQTLASRAFRASERVMYGKAARVRFKGKNQFDTLESKGANRGIRWKYGVVVWSGLALRVLINERDEVIKHGLLSRVKFVRITRRKVRGKNRFYAQLINEGLPLLKEKHRTRWAYGVLAGLDIGPSTLAVVTQQDAFLTQFAAALADTQREVRVLQRKLDRQRRAANPDNYYENGTVKEGCKVWKRSKHYCGTALKLQESHRKLAEHRKSLHGELVNKLLTYGTVFHTEKLSYKAWQKLFGKSIGTRAPGMFMARLARKAESAGGGLYTFNTRSTKLSRTCICGQVHSKQLSQRVHNCSCGVHAQRDLFSAYLAIHVDPKLSVLHVNKAEQAFSGAEPLLRAAWQQATQPVSGRIVPSSFGSCRSQSGSSEKDELAATKAGSDVALRGESSREVKALLVKTLIN